VKRLKARRKELRAIIRDAKARLDPRQTVKTKPSSKPKPSLKAFPGFTVLVFDTNILLNSLPLFTALLESKSWTLVVPLAVLTELDGLKVSPPPLGSSASAAIAYLESHVRSHASYLKVQTSRGNYLADVTIRSESIDFDYDGSSSNRLRSMDDVILRAASWQVDHFVDRFVTVNPTADRNACESMAPSRVVLVTLDRNLRLKARARSIDAAGDNDLARLVAEAKDAG